MAFVGAVLKPLVLLQLSLFLLSCLTVSGDEAELVSWAQPPHDHHHSYAPSPSPSYRHPRYHRHPPPSHPPMSHPPSPPSRFPRPPRTPLAVRGVVFCKACKYSHEADTPIVGAVVKLQCNNTWRPIVVDATTDKNGFFFIMAPRKISSYGAHKCKVFLVSSPTSCNKPTDINGGEVGAKLREPEKLPVDPLHFKLFDVGPFAFEPSNCPY